MNAKCRNHISLLAQHATHLVTKMLQDPNRFPTRGEWNRLTNLIDCAAAHSTFQAKKKENSR